MIRVCFVCLGNICRSPVAEGVFRELVRQRGLADAIEVESAGTAGYHAGEKPDPRSVAAGKRHGYAIAGRARRFEKRDFARFDYILAMDSSNYDHLRELAATKDHAKIRLLLSYDPQAVRVDVPDPYYGGDDGFDEVVQLCEGACLQLLELLVRQHALPNSPR